MLQDIDNRTTFLTLDLFDDGSPLIVGLKVGRYASTEFLSQPPIVTCKRPTDNETRRMRIYVSSPDPIRARAYIYVLFSAAHGLLAGYTRVRRPFSFAKRLHRFSHASDPDMNRMLRRVGYEEKKLEYVVEAVGEECLACAQCDPLFTSIKILIYREEESFYEPVQSEFTSIKIKGRMHCVLHTVDFSTFYSEAETNSAVALRGRYEDRTGGELAAETRSAAIFQQRLRVSIGPHAHFPLFIIYKAM